MNGFETVREISIENNATKYLVLYYINRKK
jgi:hypothetical protein